MSVKGQTNNLHTLLHGEALREFDKLASQNSGRTSARLKFIQEGLFGYLPSINSLSKQKRIMCRAILKPQYLPFKRFPARLTEMKNYLTVFPTSSDSKNMVPK